MAKKRVHEIAKEQGMSSKDVLERLQAAGLDVKAAASTIEESDALKALGNGTGNGAATPAAAAAGDDGKAAAPAAPEGPAPPAAPGGRPHPAPPPEGRRQPVRPPEGRGQPVRPGDAGQQ